MIEPTSFHRNEETALDNSFQQIKADWSQASIQSQALKEFRGFRELLEANGVAVHCYSSRAQIGEPDSIFPNNWISTHRDVKSTLVLYPMKAENRRLERRNDIINDLRNNYDEVVDLTGFEGKNLFLEGTGSLVLDRVNKIAYASISQRTDSTLLDLWAKKLDFEKLVIFHSCDQNGAPIYHTNVVMSVGSKIAVVCTEAIPDPRERGNLLQSLRESGKVLVEISFEQMINFCGNVLELTNYKNEALLIMSSRAYNAFTSTQKDVLGGYVSALHANLNTIETLGGGGARCMLAEIF
jgi:hypothetical protein